MKYNIIYNGSIVSVVDIPVKELTNYKKELSKNLPKATMERKVTTRNYQLPPTE